MREITITDDNGTTFIFDADELDLVAKGVVSLNPYRRGCDPASIVQIMKNAALRNFRDQRFGYVESLGFTLTSFIMDGEEKHRDLMLNLVRIKASVSASLMEHLNQTVKEI